MTENSLEDVAKTLQEAILKIHLEKGLESEIDLLGLKARQGIDLRLKTRQGKDTKLTRAKQIMIPDIQMKAMLLFIQREI